MKPATTTATTLAARAANECVWADPLEYRAFPVPSMMDGSAAGRRCLAEALDQADSVAQALGLLRNAAVALYNDPADQTLRCAALRAVETARGQLLSHGLLLQQVQPAAPGARFAEQAAALDLAEFSIHFPRLYREQRMWRLKAHWLAGHMAAEDSVQVMQQERAQLRAQVAHH